MSQILSVVISILLMFLAPEVTGCFSASHCCRESEFKVLERQVQQTTRHIRSVASSNACQASSKGSESERSLSPWTQVEDYNESRYPQSIWNAQCNCRSATCVSVSHCVKQGDTNVYTRQSYHGNSVEVSHDTLVFYRTPCPGNQKDLYYLQAAVYKMNVSCTCVVPQNRLCVPRLETVPPCRLPVPKGGV